MSSTTRSGTSVTMTMDLRAVHALYARFGSKARNIIRRGYTRVLAPVREQQRAAWKGAGYKRNGRKRVRAAIAGSIRIKTKAYRDLRTGWSDHACVGIDYKNASRGHRQRVAHLLERGRGGRSPKRGRFISWELNTRLIGRTLNAMNEYVLRELARA